MGRKSAIWKIVDYKIWWRSFKRGNNWKRLQFVPLPLAFVFFSFLKLPGELLLFFFRPHQMPGQLRFFSINSSWLFFTADFAQSIRRHASTSNCSPSGKLQLSLWMLRLELTIPIGRHYDWSSFQFPSCFLKSSESQLLLSGSQRRRMLKSSARGAFSAPRCSLQRTLVTHTHTRTHHHSALHN